MSRIERANEVVRNQMLWSMGAGLVPLPGVDIAAVTALQVNMIRQLCELYGVEFEEGVSKGIITALLASTAARLGSSVVKIIPIIGPVLGGVSMSALSGASTYAIGQVFIRHFHGGGTLADLDMNFARRMYEDAFEQGKELAQKLDRDLRNRRGGRAGAAGAGSPYAAYTPGANVDPQAGDSEADVFAKLEKLNTLREKGILTEEEFQAQKQRLLGQL